MYGRGVPEDFASFVTKHGQRLSAACREITGNERVADALRVDLLAAVALSWRWRPAKRREPHALARLDHLLRREVRSYRLIPTAGVRQTRMSETGPTGTADTARVSGGAELADAAWRRAGVLRRHGRVGVAAAVLVLVGFALVGPDAGPLPPPPAPEPTETPDGVTVLPRFQDLMATFRQGNSPLPSEVDIDGPTAAALPQLAAAPLPAALAVAEPNRGRLIVIGADLMRRIDDPVLVNSRLVTTSLSPGGDLIVLPSGNDLLVIDVRTGTIRVLPVGASQPNPPVVVWYGRQRVLVPSQSGALEVDLVTGNINALSGVTGTDVVTVEGNPDPPFVEMVAGGSVGSQRARMRFWRTAPPSAPGPGVVNTPASPTPAGSPSPTASAPPSASTQPSSSASPSPSAAPSSSTAAPVQAGDFDERPVFGPPWISAWLGAAWSSPLLYVRACSPATLRLPADVGVARAAIGALQPNGRYAGTLVAVDGTQLDVLGFLSANELLVSASLNGTTALLGWVPIDGGISMVASFNDQVRLSVVDLLLRS